MILEYKDKALNYSGDEKNVIKHVIGIKIRDLVPLDYYLLMESSSSQLYCLENIELSILMLLVMEGNDFVMVLMDIKQGMNSINDIDANNVGYGKSEREGVKDVWLNYIFNMGGKVLNLSNYEGSNYYLIIKEEGLLNVIGGFEDIDGDKKTLIRGNVNKVKCSEWGIYQINSRHISVNLNLNDCYLISRDGLEMKVNRITEVFIGKSNKSDNMKVVEMKIN